VIVQAHAQAAFADGGGNVQDVNANSGAVAPRADALHDRFTVSRNAG
jgi:hypothetical protein